jgi:hypothetical protein
MKGMNVKIPVARVITQLEAKLATFAKEAAEYQKAQKQYDADLAKWQKAAVAAVKKAAVTEVSIRNGKREWQNGEYVTLSKRIELTYDVATDAIGAEPEVPQEPSHMSRWDSTKQDIENALRILRLTDDEHVNATTFKAVSQYL